MEKIRAYFEKHGRHEDGCEGFFHDDECTCGYVAALKELSDLESNRSYHWAKYSQGATSSYQTDTLEELADYAILDRWRKLEPERGTVVYSRPWNESEQTRVQAALDKAARIKARRETLDRATHKLVCLLKELDERKSYLNEAGLAHYAQQIKETEEAVAAAKAALEGGGGG